jgi:hypothetical protein
MTPHHIRGGDALWSGCQLLDGHTDVAEAASSGQSDRKLPRDAELLDEADQCLAKIFQRRFLGVAFAVRTHARTQLSMSAPDAVLVEIDDDRHSNGAKFGHIVTIAQVREGRRRLILHLWTAR